MTLRRTPAPLLALGMLVFAGWPAGAVEDYVVDGARITNAASRCATSYGAGFVDLGDGTCARLNSHVRVESGLRRAAGDGLSGSTSSATLHSMGSEFMPGVGISHQLRVRSGLQSLNPY